MSSFSASRFFTPPPLPCPSVRSNDWGIWSSSSVPPGSPTPGSSLDVFLGRFPLYLPGEALGDRVAFPPSPRSSSSAGPALLGVPSSVPVEGVFSPPLCALPPLLNPSSPPPGSGMGMGGGVFGRPLPRPLRLRLVPPPLVRQAIFPSRPLLSVSPLLFPTTFVASLFTLRPVRLKTGG